MGSVPGTTGTGACAPEGALRHLARHERALLTLGLRCWGQAGSRQHEGARRNMVSVWGAVRPRPDPNRLPWNRPGGRL